jgi:short subunit dehydrogenase-like uncharacterized protein
MRDLDVILYGATGFTGRQTAAYFGAHAPEGLKWAIAGRSADKLKAVAESLPRAVETVVADAADGEALAKLARRTKVVLTTAGPFSKYGDLLVTRCVEEKTDYVDITGETPWVRTLIDRFHARAAADGTRIVPLCGYDSVPSDAGVLLVADWIRREWGQPTVRVLAAFSAKGGINGGTIDSALTLAESGQRRALADVLLLNPETHRTEDERQRSPDRKRVEWSAELDRWLAPFFMAPVNTRVVRRSNALLDTWGEGYARPALVPFTYDEALETRSRISALTITAGTGLFFGLIGRPTGRRLVRSVAPSPGQGPSDKTMDGGFFRTRLIGEAADGRKALGTFAGTGDPGNRATVKMLCEAALLLATHPRETPAREELPGGSARGGILTPATALGRPYLERLRAVGITLTVEPLA